MLGELFGGLTTLRDIRTQAESIVARMQSAGMDTSAVEEAQKALLSRLTEIEEGITQDQ